MIKWDDKYSMGIPMIDEGHKKFIDIINKAVAIKENNGNPEEIKEVLNYMSNYSLTHFATEEAVYSDKNQILWNQRLDSSLWSQIP
jgi:hemerythrin